MNKLEAITACLSGKKVRVKSWMSEVYVEYRGRTGFYIKNGGKDWDIFNWNVDQEDIWEEYIELVDFITALNHVAKGGTIQRAKSSQKYKMIDGRIRIIGSDYDTPVWRLNRYFEHEWVLL